MDYFTPAVTRNSCHWPIACHLDITDLWDNERESPRCRNLAYWLCCTIQFNKTLFMRQESLVQKCLLNKLWELVVMLFIMKKKLVLLMYLIDWYWRTMKNDLPLLTFIPVPLLICFIHIVTVFHHLLSVHMFLSQYAEGEAVWLLQMCAVVFWQSHEIIAVKFYYSKTSCERYELNCQGGEKLPMTKVGDKKRNSPAMWQTCQCDNNRAKLL